VSLLVDTHVLLWFVDGDRRLGASARAAIRDGAVISAITAWEISIKAALGKLALLDATR
jgi:PIN domain nuclease of toxin-antitoxin system